MKCPCGKSIPDRWLEGIDNPKCPACGEALCNKEAAKPAESLTEEERRKICEEEKARIEAQEQIKIEKENIKASKMPGWLMMGFIIIGLFLLIVILSSITTGKRSPTEAPKASVELSKEALEEHLRQLFYFLNDIKKSGRGLVKYELYNDGKRLLLKIDWVESNWLKIPYGDRESLVRSIHSRWITAFPGRSEILIQGYYSGKELAYSKAGEIYMV